jgi:tetratricopeptide (TPR) repeat protein
VRAYVVAGQIYGASGQYAEGRRAVDRAVQISPDESTYLSRASFRRREDIVGRRVDIDAALKLNAHSVAALTQLARIQAKAREFTSALATIDGAIAIQGDTADLLIARGSVHSMADQDALAERDFAAARAKSVFPRALNSMRWTMATAGISLTTALAACEAALAGAPNDGAIYDGRGLGLLRQGRYEEALASYDTAVKLLRRWYSMPRSPTGSYYGLPPPVRR